MRLRKALLLTLVVLCCLQTFCQSTGGNFQFIRNDGQWEGDFAFVARTKAGQVFVKNDGFLWDVWDMQKRGELLEKMHHKISLGADTIYQCHRYRQVFLGTASTATVTGEDPFDFYHNYYLGNQSSRWKANVPVFKESWIRDLYPGITAQLQTFERSLKYNLIVQPGVDPSVIRWKYEGVQAPRLVDGRLKITTALGEVFESKPFAYQLINGDTVEVACAFKLKKGVVSFELGTWNPHVVLVIDPALVFSTYSGSNNDNFGFTATYDYNGAAYGGGIVFGAVPYPGIPGSYQASFGGGNYDVMIGKFSATGTQLLYYTFLGGSRAEAPYSLVVNQNNELYILGVTGSANFPVAGNAFQQNFNGGSGVGFFGNSQEYGLGTDLFITKLDPNGAALLGSTYLGGTANDGINSATGLKHNYADEFRGEIIVDAAGNAYITTSTSSINFPVVNPAQGTSAGGQEAVVAKLTPNLSGLLWSTYLGGSSGDAGYSLQQKSNGEIYVTGGTTSANFPTTPGVLKGNLSGGTDGFITRLSPGGNTILSSTYLGTVAYDQAYILQFDQNEDVYVVGQTKGIYPIVSGVLGPVYSNPNSGQFIHKLNPTLTTTLFSTVFGRGALGQVDIVPTAFLVDICDHIYVAGWGGAVNGGLGGGSTFGMPVTPNAFQMTTDGSDFYFIVLDNDATGLLYASYFGGGVSAEHVDGGTSRFDKNGIIYEAVCAGCGSHDDFPTSPGAHSATNNSLNCNLGLFKFDVSEFSALIDPISPTVICENGSVSFSNISTGGDSFFWDFGDGSSSTSATPTHTYSQPGTYNVMLIVSDNDACVTSDTAFLQVTVEPFPVAVIDPVNILCRGDSITLQASGGMFFQWAPHPSLINGNGPTPVVFPSQTTTYTVTVSNNCGSDVATITVPVVVVDAFVSDHDTICLGSSIQLNAGGGLTYQWTPAAGLDDPFSPNPVATPLVSTTYVVTVTDQNNCSDKDTVVIGVDVFPQANAGPDQRICYGIPTTLSGSGGTNYVWAPSTGLANPNQAVTVANPPQTMDYILMVSNTCGIDYDTVNIQVVRVSAFTSPDTIICPGESVMLYSGGGDTYSWQPAAYVNNPFLDTVIATPPVPTLFIVTVTDSNGCSAKDSVYVGIFPVQTIDLGPNILIEFGHKVQLFAQGSGSFSWSPDSSLSCANCYNPVASPFSSTEYVVTLTDTNGCRFSDSVWVFVEGSLYIPNTFTPNHDNLNDIFKAYGVEIKEFEMRIFTRWGEEIFHSTSLDYGWNGLYKEAVCPIGVYVWKVDFTQLSGKKNQLIGHVNLLR